VDPRFVKVGKLSWQGLPEKLPPALYFATVINSCRHSACEYFGRLILSQPVPLLL
jgi:hypothetical protein